MPESMKNLLLKMKAELLKDLNKDLKSERNDFENEIGDFYDNTDTERGRQLFHLLSGRERDKLMLIDAALMRIGAAADSGASHANSVRQIDHYHDAAAPCQHEAFLDGAPDLDVLNFIGSTVIGSSERIVKSASLPGVMLLPSSSHL